MVRFERFAVAFSALIALAMATVFALSVQVQGQPAAKAETCLRLQLYLRSDSALCQDAQKYAETFSKGRQGICLEVIDTLADKEGLDRYWQLVRRFHVEKPRVPAFYACDRLKVGFSDATKSAPAIENLFAIHAYIRPTCQHCRDAKRFLTELAQRWKGIRLVLHDVDNEAGAFQEMTQLAKQRGINAPSFPIIYVCSQVISGYRTDATTGRQIEELLIEASVNERKGEAIEPQPEQAESHHATMLFPALWNLPGRSHYSEYALTSVVNSLPLPTSVPAADDGASAPVNPDTDLPLLPQEAQEESAEKTYTAPAESPEGIDLPWIGYVRVQDLGLPAFTLFIGLIDGFNPCAMWVLVFLLSVLVNVKDRRKIAAIAGTFVVVSGLAYFAFMAAWLSLFMLVGIARPLQIALGLLALFIGAVNVKDFFFFKKGVTMSIPESPKPGIYDRVRRIVTADYIYVAIGLSIVLAVIVNVVELLCTAGLPALYTQILTLQNLPTWKNYAYLGLYNIGYMFDDSIMVIMFVITLSHRKMRETEGRWLKLISGIVVLALGFAMIFRPDWLQW